MGIAGGNKVGQRECSLTSQISFVLQQPNMADKPPRHHRDISPENQAKLGHLDFGFGAGRGEHVS